MAVHALNESGMDESVLDDRWPEWHKIVDDRIMPVIEQVFVDAYDDTLTAAITSPAFDAAGQHLLKVQNRMVGITNPVFIVIKRALEEGRGLDEGIPELAARVEGVLSKTHQATWKNRGRTVARTEVIAASNAGAHAAAVQAAGTIGHATGEVVKEWLATADNRTRETHADADGQQVLGMDTPFQVGGDLLAYPGDPAGSPEEVINCRCTVLYHHPGDPDYPDEFSFAGVTDQQAPLTEANFFANAETTGWMDYPMELKVLRDDETEMLRDWAYSIEQGPEAYEGLPDDLVMELIDAAPKGDQRGLGAWYGYTGSKYGNMNAVLRQELPVTEMTGHHRLIAAMDEYMQGPHSATLDKDTILYRGVRPTFDYDPTAWEVGDLQPERGFLSASADETVGQGFKQHGWLMKIRAPKGTRYAPGTDYEVETILQRGHMMRVVAKDPVKRELLMELMT